MTVTSSRAPSRLLKVSEVAELLGVSERTVWSLLDAGDLPRTRIRGATRVALDAVLAFIERRTELGGAR